MPYRSKDHKRKILIYTPTYHASTGLQYRLSMLMKTLRENSFDVKLCVGDNETLTRKAYYRFGKCLLKHEYVWKILGKRAADKIVKFHPEIAILVTDVITGAVPYLKEKGIKTILFLEDLSVDWLNIGNNDRENILGILSKYVSMADAIIVPGEFFAKKIREELKVDSIVCPPGTELRVKLEEAFSRSLDDKICILHARQIVHPLEARLLEFIAKQLPKDRYVIYALKAGRYWSMIKNKAIQWYHYPTIRVAVEHLKSCPVGLIATPRAAPTFTSYWFYLSLLQPTIAITPQPLEGPHMHIDIGVLPYERNAISEFLDEVLARYHRLVEVLYNEITKKLHRRETHKKLITLLNKL